MKLTDDNARDGAAEGAHENMAQAWAWLCEQRTLSPEGADVWELRWQTLNAGEGWLTDLTHRVLRGAYRLSPLQLIGLQESRKAVWGAQDALVLKWVALSLQDQLPLHASCEHVKGHGGGKASITALHGLLTATSDAEKKTGAEGADRLANRGYTWVCRTDIRGYYRNINKATLIKQVRENVQSPVLTDLVNQYIHYTVEDGGTFHTPERGISRGCPLSPLMGALHLYDMDAHFSAQQHIHYARYMDDIIILAKSRWHLRRHTKRLMQWFSAYDFEAHPDKTQIGRTRKGFDWMGAWLTDAGVTDIAPRAKANHREKVRRLYERLARVPLWARKREKQRITAKVSRYRKRWNIWAGALLAVASGATHADGPILVLSGNNSGGDTGARFPAASTLSGPLKSPEWRSEYGYGAVTNNPDVCAPDGYSDLGLTATRNLGGNLSGMAGFKVNHVPNLVLLVRGTGDARREDGLTGNILDLSWVYDPSAPGGVRGTDGRTSNVDSSRVLCPNVAKPAAGWLSTYVRSSHVDVSIEAYALGPLQAGDTWIRQIIHGDYSFLHTGSLQSDLAKPTRIIITGLACSLASDRGNIISMGDLPSKPDSTTAPGGSTRLAMTVTCSGSNAQSDPPITLNIAFRPGPGSEQAPGAIGGIRQAGTPGYFLTLNPAAVSCSDSAGTGTAGIPVTTIRPGAAGSTYNTSVYAALCSDGTPASVGEHTINVVAELINT